MPLTGIGLRGGFRGGKVIVAEGGLSISVVIQAGGRSQRMGEDKGRIKLAGRPLVSYVLEALADLGDECLLVAHQPEAYAGLGIPVIRDLQPGSGPLHGLRIAMQAAQGTHLLTAACDMPFIERGLAEHLIHLAAARPEPAAVVPRFEGRLQPMLAVYPRGLLAGLEAALERGVTSLTTWLGSMDVDVLEGRELERFDPEGLSFFNVNRPEDLTEAERMMKARKEQD